MKDVEIKNLGVNTTSPKLTFPHYLQARRIGLDDIVINVISLSEEDVVVGDLIVLDPFPNEKTSVLKISEISEVRKAKGDWSSAPKEPFSMKVTAQRYGAFKDF